MNVIYQTADGKQICKAQIRTTRTNKRAIELAIEQGETTLYVSDEYSRTPINLCGLIAGELQKRTSKAA